MRETTTRPTNDIEQKNPDKPPRREVRLRPTLLPRQKHIQLRQSIRIFSVPSGFAMSSLATSVASAALRASSRPSTAAAASHLRHFTTSAPAAVSSSSFDSPYAKSESNRPSTLKIPSFKAYSSSKPESSNKVFSYFMAGGMGLVAAAGAKTTVHGQYELAIHLSLAGITN